ncbi:hypothetical protein Tco_1255902 [Tanacetum coccineum]
MQYVFNVGDLFPLFLAPREAISSMSWILSLWKWPSLLKLVQERLHPFAYSNPVKCFIVIAFDYFNLVTALIRLFELTSRRWIPLRSQMHRIVFAFCPNVCSLETFSRHYHNEDIMSNVESGSSSNDSRGSCCASSLLKPRLGQIMTAGIDYLHDLSGEVVSFIFLSLDPLSALVLDRFEAQLGVLALPLMIALKNLTTRVDRNGGSTRERFSILICLSEFREVTERFGVGGRLICAVKDGSMMAVTGVSMREVASVCCPKISSTPVSWFGFSMLETNPDDTDELCC